MKKKIGKIILITIMMVIMLNFTQVKADVGSFESYDSGGSSWDSGSSWSSSSSDWDTSSSYSSTGSGTIVGDIVWIVIIGASILIYIANKKDDKKRSENQFNGINRGPDLQREKIVEAKIKQIDPMFNKEEFISNVKSLFVKLQQAWTDRDWSVIRVFETNELFEQHKNQLQGYIDNNQINVMDRICVNFANLYNFEQSGDKDILTIRLNSRMTDYIIDATTKQVIRGDKTTERVNTYLLTFIRKKGLQTKERTEKISTTNCPNCGAPTQITSAGKCEYCGSIITTGEYSWVLSNLEREIK